MTETNSSNVENMVEGLSVSWQPPYASIAPLLTDAKSTAKVEIVRPGANEKPRVLLTVGQQGIERHVALEPEVAQRLAYLLNLHATQIKDEADGHPKLLKEFREVETDGRAG